MNRLAQLGGLGVRRRGGPSNGGGRSAGGLARGGRAVGWVPLVAVWQLRRKARVGDLGTDGESEREESESSGGRPARTGRREALGLTDCWCEGVGPGGQG